MLNYIKVSFYHIYDFFSLPPGDLWGPLVLCVSLAL